MSHTDQDHRVFLNLDFQTLVTNYYRSLYQFAFSMTRSEAEASDLTQQTFYIWATKGHQLRDASKVKTWLFTTLHRQFLEMQRKQTRFPHCELSQVDADLIAIPGDSTNPLDWTKVVEALARVAPPYQAPVALFYLEDYSYKEIAEILEVPLGTVKSRIARGIEQLRRILGNDLSSARAPTPRKQS